MSKELPRTARASAQMRLHALLSIEIARVPEALEILMNKGFHAAAKATPELEALYDVWMYSVQKNNDQLRAEIAAARASRC